MIRDITQNKIDYSILSIFSILYLVVIFSAKNKPETILYSTLIFSILYILWGFFHHLKNKSLTFKIMLEYFLVSALGVVIISTLLV